MRCLYTCLLGHECLSTLARTLVKETSISDEAFKVFGIKILLSFFWHYKAFYIVFEVNLFGKSRVTFELLATVLKLPLPPTVLTLSRQAVLPSYYFFDEG